MSEEFPSGSSLPPEPLPPAPAPKSDNTKKIIIIVVVILLALALLCVCIVVALPSLLMITSSSIGDVFSEINDALLTPAP